MRRSSDGMMVASMDLASFVDALRPYVRPTTDVLDRRNPDAVAVARDLLGPFLQAWFAPEVTGLEHLPPGGTLVVANHNGGIIAPDMFALMHAVWSTCGPDLPTYGLAHDTIMKAPILGPVVGAIGAVPAHPANADALLRRGAKVLVFPGGDVDAWKPFSARREVRFGGRTGFIRTALRTGVPIVPVVAVGAHETFVVLSDGRELVKRFGLKRLLRLEVLPISLTFPWGLTPGPLPFVPMPAKIRIQVLEPFRLPYGPDAADNRELVTRLAEDLRREMQHTLVKMTDDGGSGVRARLAEIVGR